MNSPSFTSFSHLSNIPIRFQPQKLVHLLNQMSKEPRRKKKRRKFSARNGLNKVPAGWSTSNSNYRARQQHLVSERKNCQPTRQLDRLRHEPNQDDQKENQREIEVWGWVRAKLLHSPWMILSNALLFPNITKITPPFGISIFHPQNPGPVD